ncbi:MAG TPA: phosphopantetheine-binding protein [Burkholderiales bacterium]|nr:phosphopantetheine-binding protein [Burkholderiales bacterium]
MLQSEVLESGQQPFEFEIARLIAEVINLDCAPEQVDPVAPLFGDGLGLDSIDLLEIALAISQTYGFSLRSDDPDNRRIFSSLRAFAAHIAQHRTK